MAASCSLSNFRASPGLPSTLYVRGSIPSGEPFFSTNVTVDFNCTANSGQAIRFGAPFNSTPQLVAPNTVATNAGSPLGARASSITVISGACTGSYHPKPYIRFNANSTCLGSATFGITFGASGGQPSGTLPLALPTQFPGTYPNSWANANLCNADCTGNVGFALASLNAPSTVAIQTLANTCALSTNSLTIALPKVSTATFPSIGTIAAKTRAALSVSCPTAAAAVGLSMYVIFTPQSNPSGSSGGAIMSTTGTATGVGITLYDRSGNVITSGTPVRLTTSIAATTYDATISAAYVQTATTVTAGDVQASGTYFLSYY